MDTPKNVEEASGVLSTNSEAIDDHLNLTLIFRWSLTSSMKIIEHRKDSVYLFVDWHKKCSYELLTPAPELTAKLAPLLDILRYEGIEAEIGRKGEICYVLSLRFEEKDFIGDVKDLSNSIKNLKFGTAHTAALTAASAFLLVELAKWLLSPSAPSIEAWAHAIGWRAGALPGAVKWMAGQHGMPIPPDVMFCIDGTRNDLDGFTDEQVELLRKGVNSAKSSVTTNLDGDKVYHAMSKDLFAKMFPSS